MRWDGRERRTEVELCFRVFENVARDARLVCAICDALLEVVQEEREIGVATSTVCLRFCVLLVPEAQQRHIVLPVIRGASEVGDFALDVCDFLEQLALDVAVDAEAVV